MTRMTVVTMMTVMTLTLVLGCESSQQALMRDRTQFEALRGGMSRLDVRQQLGTPRDHADGFYHYDLGPARDGWVYFDPDGRVTDVEWQDEETLRLDWTAQYLHR